MTFGLRIPRLDNWGTTKLGDKKQHPFILVICWLNTKIKPTLWLRRCRNICDESIYSQWLPTQQTELVLKQIKTFVISQSNLYHSDTGPLWDLISSWMTMRKPVWWKRWLSPVAKTSETFGLEVKELTEEKEAQHFSYFQNVPNLYNLQWFNANTCGFDTVY